MFNTRFFSSIHTPRKGEVEADSLTNHKFMLVSIHFSDKEEKDDIEENWGWDRTSVTFDDIEKALMNKKFDPYYRVYDSIFAARDFSAGLTPLPYTMDIVTIIDPNIIHDDQTTKIKMIGYCYYDPHSNLLNFKDVYIMLDQAIIIEKLQMEKFKLSKI